MSSNRIKPLKSAEAADLFSHGHLNLTAAYMIYLIQGLTMVVRQIESDVLKAVRIRPRRQNLLTMPGIGKILALTIMLEVGDIRRFPPVKNYSSYGRCVKSDRLSNGKSKGKGNRKNGNQYWGWAYVEAAHFARRHHPEAQRFYQRKAARTDTNVAAKALGHKLARASYWVMRRDEPYPADRLFGSP